MALTYRSAWADPDGLTRRFYDSELRTPVANYQGSEIDPDGNGHQTVRPMIQIIKDHSEHCYQCLDAEQFGELIIVE